MDYFLDYSEFGQFRLLAQTNSTTLVTSQKNSSPSPKYIFKIFKFECNSTKFQKIILDTFLQVYKKKNQYLRCYKKLSFLYQSNNTPTFSMKYVSSKTLDDVLKTPDLFKTWEIKNYLNCLFAISEAMSYLHEHLICHGNLCPSNIIIDEADQFYLVDFGLYPIKKLYIEEKYLFNEIYKDPYVENNEPTFKNDIYSFGILMCELFLAYFQSKNQYKQETLQSFILNSKKTNFKLFPNFFAQLIPLCLNETLKERPTFKRILELFQTTNENVLNENIQQIYKEFIQTNYLVQLSKKGNTFALNKLGKMYKDGIIFNQDIEKAMGYYKKAALLGNSESQNIFGVLCQELRKDEDGMMEGSHYLSLSAEQGNIHGMANYGISLLYGDGVEKDVEKAKEYLKKSADLGYSYAQVCYGYALLEYNKSESDISEGLIYIKKAMVQNLDDAFYTYGVILHKGKYVEKDDTLAMEYFRISADMGYPKAMHEFAKGCQLGRGVPKNHQLALKYYQMAAENGIEADKEKFIELSNIKDDDYLKSQKKSKTKNKMTVQARSKIELKKKTSKTNSNESGTTNKKVISTLETVNDLEKVLTQKINQTQTINNQRQATNITQIGNIQRPNNTTQINNIQQPKNVTQNKNIQQPNNATQISNTQQPNNTTQISNIQQLNESRKINDEQILQKKSEELLKSLSMKLRAQQQSQNIASTNKERQPTNKQQTNATQQNAAPTIKQTQSQSQINTNIQQQTNQTQPKIVQQKSNTIPIITIQQSPQTNIQEITREQQLQEQKNKLMQIFLSELKKDQLLQTAKQPQTNTTQLNKNQESSNKQPTTKAQNININLPKNLTLNNLQNSNQQQKPSSQINTAQKQPQVSPQQTPTVQQQQQTNVTQTTGVKKRVIFAQDNNIQQQKTFTQTNTVQQQTNVTQASNIQQQKPFAQTNTAQQQQQTNIAQTTEAKKQTNVAQGSNIQPQKPFTQTSTVQQQTQNNNNIQQSKYFTQINNNKQQQNTNQTTNTQQQKLSSQSSTFQQQTNIAQATGAQQQTNITQTSNIQQQQQKLTAQANTSQQQPNATQNNNIQKSKYFTQTNNNQQTQNSNQTTDINSQLQKYFTKSSTVQQPTNTSQSAGIQQQKTSTQTNTVQQQTNATQNNNNTNIQQPKYFTEIINKQQTQDTNQTTNVDAQLQKFFTQSSTVQQPTNTSQINKNNNIQQQTNTTQSTGVQKQTNSTQNNTTTNNIQQPRYFSDIINNQQTQQKYFNQENSAQPNLAQIKIKQESVNISQTNSTLQLPQVKKEPQMQNKSSSNTNKQNEEEESSTSMSSSSEEEEEGNANSQEILLSDDVNDLLKMGQIVENIDPIRSFKYYEKAAKLGCINAYVKCADVSSEFKTKVDYYVLAIKNNVPEAFGKLRKVLLKKRSLVEDDEEGKKEIANIFERIDDYSDAAVIYKQNKDQINFQICYKKAKENIDKITDKEQQYNFGLLLKKQQELQLALEILKKSFENGNKLAKKKIVEIEKELKSQPPTLQQQQQLPAKTIQSVTPPQIQQTPTKTIPPVIQKQTLQPSSITNQAEIQMPPPSLPPKITPSQISHPINTDQKKVKQSEADILLQNGINYYKGINGCKVNQYKALSYFKDASNLGCTRADFYIGDYYKNSYGASHMKISADAGDPEGQLRYGIYLMEGKLVPKDIQMAMHYFELAADQGLAEAQFEYGREKYEHGITEREKNDGINYLQKSVNQEYPDALYYFSKIIKDIDPEYSERLYKSSLEKNSQLALKETQNNL